VAYFANRKLFKVSVRGGPPVALADAPNGRGAAWADDGSIYVAPDRAGTGIASVAASGGTLTPVTTLSGKEATHRWPQPLPRGAGILYTAHSDPSGGFDEANLFVQPLDGGAAKLVRARARYGRYVDSGHLLYVLGGALHAVAFDLRRLETIGEAVPLVQGVASNVGSGGAQFDVAQNGTLVYLPGIDDYLRRSVDWIDASGRRSPLRGTLASWTDFRLAPDGSRLAMSIRGTGDIWTYDIARDQLGRVTHDGRSSGVAVWSPDGQELVFTSQGDLYLQRADGAGEPRRLTTHTSAPAFVATSWHPQGTALLYHTGSGSTEGDLWILPMTKGANGAWAGGEPTVFLKTAFNEMEASFSPDGRWIAYQSNETGRDEIYVRPFPGPGGKAQVSSDEGMYPIWSLTRSELFFRNDGGIYVASYSAKGDIFLPDKPRPWAAVAFEPRGGRPRQYDLHPDGTRFAVPGLSQEGSERQESAVFVFHVFDELRRLAPVPQ
jgi:serine/threonine-protein kinase